MNRPSTRGSDTLGLSDSGVGPAAEPGGREEEQLGAAVRGGDGERGGAAGRGQEREETAAGVGVLLLHRARSTVKGAPWAAFARVLLLLGIVAADERAETGGRPRGTTLKEPSPASSSSTVSSSASIQGRRREAGHQVRGVHPVDAAGSQGRAQRGLRDGSGLFERREKRFWSRG